jgi:osmoprotectant transport system permease protein
MSAASLQVTRSPVRAPRVDALGLLLAAVGCVALAVLPFIVAKANRIVPGRPLGLFEALPAPVALACVGALACAALVAVSRAGAAWRLGAALLGIVVVSLAAARAADVLTPLGNRVVRIAPGAGCWVLLAALGLLAIDALTRLRPRPLVRVLLLAMALAVAAGALAHGTFDHLSIMREYQVNAARFGHELRQHLWLALGSLAAAVIVAFPLGVLCHRLPRLRGAILGALNFVQTIPAIALFGLLMAPLGALAAAVPLAAALGIRGIGTAPALLALFLYSLLPVVANTVVGLERVSQSAVDAAHGMGMTRWQVLRGVEFPLALPVIVTGIRIVLVQNIGLVAVAALIGAGGLGAFIFQGIGQTAIDLVLLGAIPTVVLAMSAAVLLDALVESMQRVPA